MSILINKLKIKFKVFIVYNFVKLLNLTYSYEFHNKEIIDNLDSYLLAFWHQNLPGSILTQWNIPHAVVVSNSRDGELVSYVCEKIGYHVARGSSHRGGTAALKKMIRLLRAMPGALTIDGPTGPAKIPKPGIFELSLISKTPIIPYVCVSKSNFIFTKSWDQMRLPKPFSKIIVNIGGPIIVKSCDKAENFNSVSQKLSLILEKLEKEILK